MNTIPIQQLMDEAKADFVGWLTGIVVGALLTAVPWLAWAEPAIQLVIKLAIVYLVGKGELGLFVLNTQVLTSDQAKDYREAVAKRILAPDDIPDDQWEAIDNAANLKLVQLVRFTA